MACARFIAGYLYIFSSSCISYYKSTRFKIYGRLQQLGAEYGLHKIYCRIFIHSPRNLYKGQNMRHFGRHSQISIFTLFGATYRNWGGILGGGKRGRRRGGGGGGAKEGKQIEDKESTNEYGEKGRLQTPNWWRKEGGKKGMIRSG